MTPAHLLTPAVLEPPAPDPSGLDAPPPGWETTRDALHTLAEHVIAPARAAVDGRIRLRWLPGGFGTPRFGADRQVRVDGGDLVQAGGGSCRRQRITSCRDAAGFVNLDRAGRPKASLTVDADATRWLSDFYAFVLAVLEDVRREIGGDEPVLWPEHFDYAITAGDEATGSRANYGGSPGDEHHTGPYLYVVPWEPREGELWNATSFGGARLGLDELLAAADPRATALEFMLVRARALEGIAVD